MVAIARLRDLLEVGRRHSAADEQLIQSIHDSAVSLGAMCGASESVREQARLRELGLSHNDIYRLLSGVVRSRYPSDVRVWIRDIYEDRVVWEVEEQNGVACYMASYAILDGEVTLGDPVEVVPVTSYLPVGEAARLDPADLQEVIRKEGGEWVLYSRDGSTVLGRFRTRKDALKRERQIQFFKRQREAAKVVIPEDVDVDLDGYEPSDEEIQALIQAVQDLIKELEGESQESGCPPCEALARLAEQRGGNIERIISTFGRWAGGKHTNCVARLRGKAGISDPERLCAWLKDRYLGTTTWRGKHKEAGQPDELSGDLVPLVERAVRTDGTITVKIIAPGQGSSGYYPAEVLKRDGPKVFRAGTHMYLDHPTVSEETERPERSVRDLAGVLVSDARWEENGPAGPGLYAEASLRSDLAPLIEEIAPHIGVSIRALGRAKEGEVDGRKTRVVEAIEQARSVDFVTLPGAGGRVVELMESVRMKGGSSMDVQVTLEEARKQIEAQAQELARLREALMLREARDVVAETLARIEMPEPTRHRLLESLSANPPVQDGVLDREALVQRVQEAAQAELEYLARITGAGRVVGMGASERTPTAEQLESRLVESFRRLGLSETAAKVAAAGRI